MRLKSQAEAKSLGVQMPNQESGVSLGQLKLKLENDMVGFAHLTGVPSEQVRGYLVEPLPKCENKGFTV